MWWGGGGPNTGDDVTQPRVVEPEIETGSEGSGSPPVDLMADEEDEESTRTLGANEDDDFSDDDFGDFQEKFAAQEKLLGELRGVLKSNEDKLESKSKVVKEYAARLSSKPSFYGASNLARSSSTPVVIPRHDESHEVEGSSSRMSKLKMLKKELDEQRLKETEELKQHQNLEVLVRQLQMEIAERDRMISSLREDQFSVTSLSFAGSPTNSPFMMSPERGGSPSDISPNRSPPLGSSLDSATSFGGYSFRSMPDNRYLEMSEKNIELERRILDLEESLREKDELIKARTQAVHLMSADMSAKGKSTLDQLEETRLEMKTMQSNFAEKEAEWRQQMSILKTELVSKDKKVQALSESLEKLDQVRADMCSKQEELQEKITVLQDDIFERKVRERTLVEEKSRSEEESFRKINLLEQRLEIADSSNNIRREKYLEELRICVSDSEISNKLEELENEISELEEEKGNLQLKLVDSEEIVAQELRTKEQLKLLTEKFHHQDDTIDEQNRTIEKMESEKMELSKTIQHLREDLHQSGLKLQDAQANCDDLSTLNVKLEMRSVSLEEERDRMKAEIKDLETTMKAIKEELQDHVSQYSDLKQEHSNMVLEYHRLEELHSRCQSTQKLFDKEFVDKSTRIKELTISMSHLETVLDKKNSEIAEMLLHEGSRLDELETLSTRLSSLEIEMANKEKEVTTLRESLDESSMAAQLQGLKEKLSELNDQLQQASDRATMSDLEACQLRESLIQAQVEETRLREELHSALSSIDDAVSEKGILENENRLLTDQAAQERCNLLKANELVEELRERIVNLEQLIENAALEKIDRESSLVQTIEERDNYKIAVAELKAKLEALDVENQDFQQKILVDKKAVEDLQDLLNAKIAALQNEHNRGETLSLRIQEQEELINEKESLINQLRNQQQVACDSIKDQTDIELAELKKSLDLNCSELANYSAEIEALKLEVDSRNIEIAKLKNMEIEIEKLTIEKEELNSLIAKMRKSTETLPTIEKNAWDEDFEGFGGEKEDEKDESNRDLEYELQQAEIKNQELSNSIVEYEKKLLHQECQMKLQQKDDSIVYDLELQIQRLREQNEELKRENRGKNEGSEHGGEPRSHVDGWDDELPFEEETDEKITNKEKLISLRSNLVSAREELSSLKDFVRSYEQEGVQQLQQINRLIQSALCAQQKEETGPNSLTATTLSPLLTVPPTEGPEEQGDGWDEDFGGFGDELSENQDEDIDNVQVIDTAPPIPKSDFDQLHNQALSGNSACVDALNRLNQQLCTISPDDFSNGPIDNMVDFIEKLEAFVSSLHSRFLSLSNIDQASSEEIKKLKEKIDNGHKLFTELEEARAEESALVERLNTQVTELKSIIANHESALASEKEVLAKKEDRLKFLESSYNELLANKPPDMQALVLDRDKQKAKSELLTKKCKTLIVKCKELEEKALNNEKELNQSASNIDTLASLLEEREKELESLRESEISSSNLEESFDKKARELKQQVSELEEKLIESEEKINQQNSEINFFKHEATTIQAEKKSYEAEIERLSIQVASLEVVIEESKYKLQEEASLNISIQQSLTLHEQELDLLKAEKENLMGEIERVDIEKKSYKDEIERLSCQVVTLETVNEESKHKLQQVDSLNTFIQQTLGSYEQELATLKIEKENLLVEVNSLRNRNESQTRESDELSKLISEMKVEIDEFLNAQNLIETSRTSFETSFGEMNKIYTNIRKMALPLRNTLDQINVDSVIVQSVENFIEELDIDKVLMLTNLPSLESISQNLEALTNEMREQLKQVSGLHGEMNSLAHYQNQLLGERDDQLESARRAIEDLENRLAGSNARLEQVLAAERPLDLAEFNRPPPDVTQYQGVQLRPDVAHHPSASVQPDLMPQNNFQANASGNSHYDWNDEEGAGWGDDDWGVEPDDNFQNNLLAAEDLVEDPVPIIHVQNYFNEPLGNDAVFDVQPLGHQQDENRFEGEARVQGEIQQQDDELSRLRDRLMTLELRDQEMQISQSRLDSLVNIIATMNVDFDQSNQTVDPEISLQSYRDELLALRKVSRVSDHQRLEIESLREELSKCIDTITLLRREQSSGEERIASYQIQLESHLADLESLRRQLLEKSESCSALEGVVSSSKKAIEEKTSEYEAQLEEANNLRKQLEQVSGEFGQHSTEFSALQKSYYEKSEEFDALLSKSSTYQSDYSNKLQEFEELLQLTNFLQKALDEKTMEHQNLMSKMSEICQKEEALYLPDNSVAITEELPPPVVTFPTAPLESSDCVDSHATPFFSWNENPFGNAVEETTFDVFYQGNSGQQQPQYDSFQQQQEPRVEEHAQPQFDFFTQQHAQPIEHYQPQPQGYESVSLHELNQQILQLKEALDAKDYQLGNESSSFAEEIRQLKSQLDSAESTNASLNKELSSRPDQLEFDRVKEEIAVLLEQVQTGNIEISHLRMRISELEELNEALVVERSNLQKDVHELKTDTDNLKLKVEPSEDIKTQEQSNVEEREMTPSSAFSTETSCADQETIGIDQVSSYFQPASQLFGSSDSSYEFEVSTVEPANIVPDVEIKQEVLQQSNDDQHLEWYKAELARYQQAINDWNSWAEANCAETATLHANLSQCMEAYNTVTAELATLKETQSTQTSEQDIERLKAEVLRLKSLLQSRQIEIDDLTETVDRLKFEKDDLQEDLQILETKLKEFENFDKRQDQQNYQLLYDELKSEYDAIIDQNAKLSLGTEASTEELTSQTYHIRELQQSVEAAEFRAVTAENSLREVQEQIVELKSLHDNLLAEKCRLNERIDTLEEGNEKFFEMKEKQDQEIEMLRTFESDWKRRHDALQWQLTEMEQQMETQKTNVLKSDREQELLNKVAKLQEEVTNTMGQNLVLKNNQDAYYKENASLKMEVLGMKHSVNEIEQACEMLKEQLRDAGVLCSSLTQEKEKISSEFSDLLDKFETAQSGLELMQNIIVQRDQLADRCQELQAQVLALENQVSEMSLKAAHRDNTKSSPSKDYAEFQNINQKLQNEIQSLRGYIDDQQHVIAELQQTPFGHSSSQDLVMQLQKQIQEKTELVINLQSENDSLRRIQDESEREDEIRKLFVANESTDFVEHNLSMENERLKNDLNQSVRENRQLSQQLEAWKKQLSSFNENSPESFKGSDYDDNDFDNSPVMLRMRQEQAYRSAAALQLRVEELTLEVTKLLEERDTLQIKLSNVMRQFERHKESASRASTARSTPVPWTSFVDSAAEIRDLRQKLDELGRLNYALDIELQKEREGRQLMQSRLTGSPRRILERPRNESSSQEVASPGGVIHL